uniref:Uncharacterized protein n=1 Tax=Anguilla anguilla TaxID=7936 RepID=A0A0E9SKT2_ANGAN
MSDQSIVSTLHRAWLVVTNTPPLRISERLLSDTWLTPLVVFL